MDMCRLPSSLGPDYPSPDRFVCERPGVKRLDILPVGTKKINRLRTTYGYDHLTVEPKTVETLTFCRVTLLSGGGSLPRVEGPPSRGQDCRISGNPTITPPPSLTFQPLSI